MMQQYENYLRNMAPMQMIENATLFIILILGLVMFFRSSSPFHRYFIPLVCILATVLRIVHWAYHGNEPAFMTPIVTTVSTWLS